MAASPRSNTIQLSPNVPVDLVLKYQTGRVIESTGNVMFTTMDGMCLFLKPEDAHKVHALGLRTNEPFRILKRIVAGRGTEIIVSRIEEQRPAFEESHKDAPTAAATAERIPSTSQPQNNSLSGILARCYISAIDALILAKEYADMKGVSLRITEEEIRTSAHCIFIEVGKMKERSLRYGGAR